MSVPWGEPEHPCSGGPAAIIPPADRAVKALERLRPRQRDVPAKDLSMFAND
jgi:hypothetical protein